MRKPLILLTRSLPQVCCRFILLVVVSLFCGGSLATEKSMSERASVQQYIQEVVATHGLDQSWLLQVFDGIYPQQSVIDRISRPAERVLSWYEYKPIFLTEKRIRAGVRFASEHAQILARVEEEFQVPAEIITAIIGVETFYGIYTGKDHALSALATLAFEYPPRASFFRRELTEFLLLSREERLDPLSLTGSYAAAMGMPQFIASSYRQYAVDFDQDGRRDLWSSKADVIGSVANYFKRHGWRSGEPVAERVDTRGNSYKTLITKSLKPSHSLQDLRAKGIETHFRDARKVSVMDFKTEKSKETWVGFHNFYVITRYNHSRLYAMAVYQLSQALKNAGV